MTAPKRLAIKLFFDNPEAITTNDIVSVFQGWIQDSRVEGLLIDVVDYHHVHNGPGIILIGHEGDYVYDFGDSRIGIQYTLKQTADFSLTEALAITLRRTLQAAYQLESEKSLNGIHINASELQISFRDRLNYPNSADMWIEVIPEVQAILKDCYTPDLSISALEGDDREPLTLRVSSVESLSFTELLGNVAITH
jgi:hypothetical protein